MSNFENDSDLFADLETISFAEWLTEYAAADAAVRTQALRDRALDRFSGASR